VNPTTKIWNLTPIPELENRTHHPDIQEALDHLGKSMPAATQRASAALSFLLRRSCESPPGGVGWRYSSLTGDGFPLEFSFGTPRTALRYTADVAGGELLLPRRLPYAVDLLQRLGQVAVEPTLLDRLSAIQRTGSLTFGAWIGGRHTADDDSFKLYAEIPLADLAVHKAFLRCWLPCVPILYDRKVQLRMVGYEAEGQQIEFYFRVRQLEVSHLPQLLRPMGLDGRAGELLELIADLHSYPLQERLPGGSSGFSYSVCPARGRGVFALFLFARALWGGDGNIRRRVASVLQSRGHDPSAYLRLTSRLAERNLYQTYHGLVGLAVADGRPVQIGIGVRPPPSIECLGIGLPRMRHI
jgi:hypothetical protein